MIYRNFLFDWDGCLVNSLPVWFDAMKHALGLNHVTLSDREVNLGFSSWDYFRDHGVDDLESFRDDVYQYVNHHLDQVKPNAGARELLAAIRDQGGKSAVVSSSDRFKIQYVAEKLDLVDYFDCILGREDVTSLKPSAEPLETAMNQMGSEVSTTLMAGDSGVDISAGKNARVATVLLDSDENRQFHTYPGALEVSPDYRVTHLSGIAEIAGL